MKASVTLKDKTKFWDLTKHATKHDCLEIANNYVY